MENSDVENSDSAHRDGENSGDHDQVEKRADRVPDQGDVKDTDGVVERTDAPADGGETGFDTEAPGNYVDDDETLDIPEPNEPA